MLFIKARELRIKGEFDGIGVKEENSVKICGVWFREDAQKRMRKE
jgi:hypothetical protein